MKPTISIFLGLACLTLACALVWHGGRRGNTVAESSPTADFSPMLPRDDVTLLDRPVGDLQMANVSLEDAARVFAEWSKTTVSVDWPALAEVNVNQNTAVSLTVTNVVLADALDALQVYAGTPKHPLLGYYIQDGIITLTSADEAPHHTITAFFNIRPLVEQTLAYSNQPIAYGNSGQLISREEVVEQIYKLITDLVASDSWKDAGGVIGSIREMGGVMIVEQTPANIREIRIILEGLHQAMIGHDFPPFTRWTEATTKPARPATVGGDSQGREVQQTAYINIRPLIVDLIARNPDFAPPVGINGRAVDPEAAFKLERFIEDTVSKDSWQGNGGQGAMTYLGGVLCVTQSPANIAAVRTALLDLHAAILRNEFPAPTQPSETNRAPSKHSN